MRLLRVTLRRRRNEWGEYVVRAYGEGGRRYPEGDYFTDDWEDARQTAETMRKSCGVTQSTNRGRGMRMTRKRLLAKLLYTASCWHGSTGKGPLAMLQLASMRKVLSEEHRKTLIDEIMDDIRVSMAWAHDGQAVESNLEEIRELTLLWEEVASCKIGAEWLTDRENLRYGDELYEKGLLRKSEV